MFSVDQHGLVTRSDPAPGSHPANVLALVPPPSDFDSLSQEARISSLLMPDLLTNAVAPSTAKSYESESVLYFLLSFLNLPSHQTSGASLDVGVAQIIELCYRPRPIVSNCILRMLRFVP